ncbi:nitrite/sulfite reductase [Streptomyces olivaceus]|uniref:nitrite/sulfite reductase n=1 Tax=Streptomyces olivaceus TaxID=47716 RepID=UPI001CCF991D|nr:nitrite/sulfite reductase [Streptomyces olivaceus]MBZ6141208.1 nitrite/sulfite reductase [Streptomyces olivaceus]MBZ6168880.1 nitrite/sulfite reductase [Streptomyces olivaceus]
MLAAVPTAPPPSSPQATPALRDRGDACPGALRLHAADDGALARVRVPGGVLTVRQARVLADAALRLGDGELHLTSRGNVQLRGLRDACGGELAGLLEEAGLLPSPEHERVRNVVASPLSGLDGRGAREVRPWLTALDAALCASTAARGLSGRFLFALDDGRGDVASLGADVTVRATAGDGALISLGSARESLRVAADDAPGAALLAAEVFLEFARDAGERVWRVDELGPRSAELAVAVRRRVAEAGIGCVAVPTDGVPTDGGLTDGDLTDGFPKNAAATAGGPPPGVRGSALCVHAPLGRLTAVQWRELTDAAPVELRLTPWRGIVVPAPDTTASDRGAALSRLAAAGLVTDPSSPWLRVGACVGRPGCGKSRADVRADAARTLAAAGASHLPLYWSGCERRCGHPGGGHVDVLAAPDGGYRLTAPDGDGPPRTTGLDDVSHLPTALAAITP